MLVTIICLVGTIPGIALQLKAVSSSVAAMVDPTEYGIGTGNLYFIDLPLVVAFVLAASPSSSAPATPTPPNTVHHLILAIAMESVVKLSWPSTARYLRGVLPVRRD